MDIWSTYMTKTTSGDPVLNFPHPDKREFVPLARIYAVNPAPTQTGKAPASVRLPLLERLIG